MTFFALRPYTARVSGYDRSPVPQTRIALHATQSRSHPTARARPWCDDCDVWPCRGTDPQRPLQQSGNHGKACRLHPCGRGQRPRPHDLHRGTARIRRIYIAGQLGYDGTGKQGADFREQATLVYENLKAAIERVGGKMENVVKLNAFLTDIRAQLPIYREVRDKFVNVAAPPASTTLEVPKLAREGALLEVEAVAVLPAR